MLRELAGQYQRDGRHDMAVRLFREVAQRAPANAVFQIEYSRALVYGGRWQELATAAIEAQHSSPADLLLSLDEAPAAKTNNPAARAVAAPKANGVAGALSMPRNSREQIAAVDVIVVVFGEAFTTLFLKMAAPNICALVQELPPPIRVTSRVRILSTASDIESMRNTVPITNLAQHIHVDFVDAVDMADFEAHRAAFGIYGPMVVAQARAVVEASKRNAGLIFHPPDLVFGAGSYATMLAAAARGKRIVVGPSVRAKLEPMQAALLSRLARDDGRLLPSNRTLCALALRHWHKMNDFFWWSETISMPWKAFAFYRVTDGAFLCRFFNGPTFFAWPAAPLADFSGFVDHALVTACCRSPEDVWVVEDSDQLLACDLAPESRDDNLPYGPGRLRAYHLLTQLLHPESMNEMQLAYGGHSCRVHAGGIAEADWAQADRTFSGEIDGIIRLAIDLRSRSEVAELLFQH